MPEKYQWQIIFFELVVGSWLLVVGCWLLVVGCWLLAVGWVKRSATQHQRDYNAGL
jgi:hypothetical protein